LRMSRCHLEMVLWVMTQAEAVGVPSLYALHSLQKKLQKQCGVATQRFVSSVGNILYVNDITDIIGKDYSNPQTVPLLQHYPVEMTGAVTETWEATRWRELPLDLLTPMYRQGLKDYYVNKLA
ncbi:hypothetical protein JB92DRAFT_2556962, partial [Gautieria morchelliformis]